MRGTKPAQPNVGGRALGDYRVLSYEAGSAPAAGVLIGETVHDAASLLDGVGWPAGSVIDILQHWEEARPRLERAADNPPAGGRPLGEVKLLAPLLYPSTLYFAGANYWDHMHEMAAAMLEMTGVAPPVEKLTDPWLSLQSARSSIAGPGETVHLPAFSSKVDWEAEVGLVIGRAGKDLDPANALDCVAGYMIVNDLSARDYLKREGSPFIYDFLGQKCFDGSNPMGPWITPRQAIADPTAMSIKLWVNDELKQDSNTGQLIHDFVEILVYLSSRVTLQPGDVIMTGTPAGVGFPRGTFLKSGDKIRIEIGGCGVLETPVV